VGGNGVRCLLLVSGVVESWCVVLYRIGGGGSRPTAPRATTTGEEEEETAWGWGRGRACVGRRRGGERRAVLSGCRRPPPAQHSTALHHVRRAGVSRWSQSQPTHRRPGTPAHAAAAAMGRVPSPGARSVVWHRRAAAGRFSAVRLTHQPTPPQIRGQSYLRSRCLLRRYGTDTHTRTP
jgi:hypothetical protein